MEKTFWNLLILLLSTFNLTFALSQLELNFIIETQHATKGQCLYALFELSNSDEDIIASRAVRPLIIVKKGLAENSTPKFQEMMSVRKAPCVIVFCGPNGDINYLSTLLKYSRKRLIFIFGAANSYKPKDNYLFEDTNSVLKVSQETLLLKRFCTSSNTPSYNVWTSNSIKQRNILSTLLWNSCSSTLRGKNITISAVFSPPSTIFLPRHRYAGSEIDTLNVISQKIGFKYYIKEEVVLMQKDEKTHAWIGVSGSIINGSAQFGIGTMPLIRPEGISTYPVEFSPQMSVMEASFLTTKPRPLPPLGNFIRPFSPSVWICLVAMMVICTMATALVNGFERRVKLSLGKVLFDFNCILWAQNLPGTLTSPKQRAFFLIFGFWMVLSLYIHAAYFCNLRANIIKKVYEDPIESDKDVVKFDKYVFMPAASWFVDSYQKTRSSEKKIIYAKAVERKTIVIFPKGVLPASDEEKMIQKGGVRIILKNRGSALLMNAEKRFGYQPFRAARTVLATTPLAIAMQMYQPWREEFDRVACQIVASGIMEHFSAKYLPNNKYSAEAKDNADVGLEPYEVEHVMGSLIILLVGLCLATVAMGMELVMKKYVLIALDLSTIKF